MLCALLALGFTAMSGKPKLTVAFFVQANQLDTNSFSTPLTLLHSDAKIFIRKIPELTEDNIIEIYPIPASDGTYGCVFKLDEDGKVKLTSLSTRMRGSVLVALINGEQVADLLIDRPVSDGLITIPDGITPQTMTLLKKSYRVYKAKPKSDKKKKKKPISEYQPDFSHNDDSSFATHHD